MKYIIIFLIVISFLGCTSLQTEYVEHPKPLGVQMMDDTFIIGAGILIGMLIYQESNGF